MFRTLSQRITGHGLTGRSQRSTPRRRQVRPSLEGLEGRQLLTVTYHGGAVLPNVEVQALYYGANWYTNSYYYGQTGYLEGFLNNVVNSSYMDMLNKDGYGVGRGSFTGGKIALANAGEPYTNYDVSDSQLRSTLQAFIDNGTLAAPDSNRLYVIFTDPYVEVTTSFGTSQSFMGYHGAFAGTNASGQPVDIHYAVIACSGAFGTNGNAGYGWSSAMGQFTEVASQELANAVTDPNGGYKTEGWADGGTNGEIGNLVAGQTVYLNGYQVQRIADQNDQAMTPAGATSAFQTSFVLQTNGNLDAFTPSGSTLIASGIASISDQSIDNRGEAMIDVVTTGGLAYEYHEGFGIDGPWWNYLGSGVKSAKAGQGVSYVLFVNEEVWEYVDSTGRWNSLAGSGASIDAGTDKIGVNMVDVVFYYGVAVEISDSSGWHSIASGVRSISAGQQGVTDYVTTGGSAYWFNDASGVSDFLASGVAAVTTGTDQNGNYMIDLLLNGGNLYEYRVGTGWTFLDSGVTSIAKAHAGFVDMVFTWGAAWGHNSSGWSYLTGSASTAS